MSRDAKEKPDRVLREREVVDLFMACGIYEHTAKDIVKTIPELTGATEKQGDTFKVLLREAISIIDKEGIPEIIAETHQDAHEHLEQDTPKRKVFLCKICKDAAAIHVSFPDNMRRFFRRAQGFRDKLTKEDWLCRGCYADWYRENRELLQDIQSGNIKYEEEKDEEPAQSEDAAAKLHIRKKERYVKNITLPIFLIVKYLDPKAVNHRKMLLRYITLNQIRLNQVAAALWYLRKIGNGILDQEDFEKRCGIGQYEDTWGYSMWKEQWTKTEILRLNESERRKKKEQKRQQAEREAKELKKKEEDEKHERERQKQIKETLETAEKEAEEKLRAEKWRKLKDQRKKEDEDVNEARKTADALREKRQEKREGELKKKRNAREVELRGVELALKRREEDLRKKKEEFVRKQKQEAAARQAERKQNAIELRAKT